MEDLLDSEELACSSTVRQGQKPNWYLPVLVELFRSIFFKTHGIHTLFEGG